MAKGQLGRSLRTPVLLRVEVSKIMKTLVELVEPDPTTARFSPYGLLQDRAMSPADSAAYIQEMVGRAELADNVPEDVRRSFARIRGLHVYGVFQYGFFSLADQAAWIFMESALGVRFVDRLAGRIPFVQGATRAILEASSYQDVTEAVAGPYSYRQGWRLEGHEDYGGGRFFNGSYLSLMRWAHREGVLASWLLDRWTRNEVSIRAAVATKVSPPRYAVPDHWAVLSPAEQAAWWPGWRDSIWIPDEINNFVRLRNLVAHPRPGHTITPIDSAHAVVTVAEFVNAIWA